MDENVTYFVEGATFSVNLLIVLAIILAMILNGSNGKRKK